MNLPRRPVTLFVTAATVAVVTGAVLGVTTHSDAAPAYTATTTTAAAAPVNAKVPGAEPCCGRAFLQPGGRLDSTIADESTLQSGGLAAGRYGSYLTIAPYFLSLQTDGNLVEYRIDGPGRNVAVWAAGTRSSTPTTLTFQSDGNVVLRNRAGQALWATGTAGRGAVYFDVYGNGQVVTQDSTGHVISAVGPAVVASPGIVVQEATSPSFLDSSTYRYLNVQRDGNLVEYLVSGTSQRAVWSTHTAGVGAVRLDAQGDGNLVLRQLSTGRAVWASGSHGPTAYYQLDVQDDGNVVYYRTDGIRRVQAVWATGIRN